MRNLSIESIREVNWHYFLYQVSFQFFFLCIAYAVKVKATLNELKEILVAIIGALSGTLGFIVGFYYKSIKEQ